jgi:hypothetical protein
MIVDFIVHFPVTDIPKKILAEIVQAAKKKYWTEAGSVR